MGGRAGRVEYSNFKVTQDDRKSFASSLVLSDFTPAPTEEGYFGILALASSPPVVNCSHLNMWGGGGRQGGGTVYIFTDTPLSPPPFSHHHIRTFIYSLYYSVLDLLSYLLCLSV